MWDPDSTPDLRVGGKKTDTQERGCSHLQSINNKGAAAEGANTRTLASSSSFFGNDTRGQGLVLSPSTGHV